MNNYEEEYLKIVGSQPPREYKSPEEEAWNIPRYSLLKNEEIRYGEMEPNAHKNEYNGFEYYVS